MIYTGKNRMHFYWPISSFLKKSETDITVVHNDKMDNQKTLKSKFKLLKKKN